MKTPHKHAELIKAWADGAEIERWFASVGKWLYTANPNWDVKYQYRVKPEPKPDVVIFAFAEKDQRAYEATPYQLEVDNLRLTFDGETGKLKKAEVLK